MTAVVLARTRFDRALRALPPGEFERFVAAVWAARGWETGRRPGVVIARRDGRGNGRRVRVRVVSGPRSFARFLRDPGADTVVVRGGLAARAVRAVARITSPESDPAVVDDDDLYEFVAYAIGDDDRAAIEREFLDAGGPSLRGATLWLWVARAARRATRALGSVRPSREAFAALVVLALVVAVALAAPSLPAALSVDPPGAGPSTAVTPADPPTRTPTPPPPTVREAAARACPPPPADLPSAALRPAVRGTASAGGLDGWELVATQNIAEWQFDPNDQRARVVPEDRHIAVYVAPQGTRHRLVVDRWGSGDRAERALAETAAPVAVVWGRYTLAVSSDGAAPRSRELLAAVSTPEGPQLGSRCVATLAGA